jgi:hypothetical protein
MELGPGTSFWGVLEYRFLGAMSLEGVMGHP